MTGEERERWVAAAQNMSQSLTGHEAQAACAALLPALDNL